MKGYYIFFGTNSSGVNRKIDMQIAEFSKYMYFQKIEIHKPSSSLAMKIIKSFPFVRLGYDFCEALDIIDDPGCIYIRRTTIDKGLIEFLSQIRRQFPKCKIIWEIPAYPYFKDSYCNNFKHFMRMLPLYVKDCYYRRYLRKYVDYISTFSFDDEILGIQTLKIRNGIDVDSIKPVDGQLDDTIDLISVAMMSPHHGYERLINGLYNYYNSGGKRRIIYHCIGYGSEEKFYRDLVKRLSLEEHVIFYGKKEGEELVNIYNNMDIAVASLGIYKKSIKIGSFIKTGEYLSKGLPMLTGCPVDVLHDEFKYFIEFPNDDSSIDISKLVDFYDNIYIDKNRTHVVKDIREYAFKVVDMKVALKPVTDLLR